MLFLGVLFQKLLKLLHSLNAFIRTVCSERIVQRLQDQLSAEYELIEHRYKCSFQYIVTHIFGGASSDILYMCIADPCNFSTVTMDPTLILTAAYPADDLTGKCEAVLILT